MNLPSINATFSSLLLTCLRCTRAIYIYICNKYTTCTHNLQTFVLYIYRKLRIVWLVKNIVLESIFLPVKFSFFHLPFMLMLFQYSGVSYTRPDRFCPHVSSFRLKTLIFIAAYKYIFFHTIAFSSVVFTLPQQYGNTI